MLDQSILRIVEGWREKKRTYATKKMILKIKRGLGMLFNDFENLYMITTISLCSTSRPALSHPIPKSQTLIASFVTSGPQWSPIGVAVS